MQGDSSRSSWSRAAWFRRPGVSERKDDEQRDGPEQSSLTGLVLAVEGNYTARTCFRIVKHDWRKFATKESFKEPYPSQMDDE